LSPTNLGSYKKIKKLTRVVEDLLKIQKLFNANLQIFSTYKKYTPVKEVLNSLTNNKLMVDMYLKKFQQSLEDYENEVE
jgi:hypothetical protein